MQSTKSQILAALKRRGGCSVDELAGALGLAPMTVRQHLAMLERDNLVASVEERQRTGRPHFIYSLTEQGEDRFPRRFDRLTRKLLHEVGLLDAAEIAGLAAEQKTALLFNRLADRIVREQRPRLERLPLAQRVAEVSELLRAESGFAEWEATDAGYEIRDYNCFYRTLCDGDGEGCCWHERILGALLGRPVECAGTGSRTDRLCRFIVPVAPSVSHQGEPAVRQELPDQPDIVPLAPRRSVSPAASAAGR